MMILYHLGISSQNGREDGISSVTEKPSFYSAYYNCPWKKHANPGSLLVVKCSTVSQIKYQSQLQVEISLM